MKNQKDLTPKYNEKDEVIITTKLYKRFDALDDDLDESDYEIETLEQMKGWLQEFWTDNPNEDTTEQEHDEWMEEISHADESELFEMLAGIGYSFDELEGK